MSRLPEPVLAHALGYLDGLSMLCAENVSASWRLLATAYDQQLWQDGTSSLWGSLTWNRASPAIQNLFERIKMLPIGKLKRSLVGIDLSRCVEKVDFQRMLLTHLVFQKHMRKELAGTDPRYAGKYVTMRYPDWSLRIGPWKASFFFTARELRRKEMFASELCAVKWQFFFKQDEDNAQGWACQFKEDSTMASDMNQHTYSWRIIACGDESAPMTVQVDNYPVLTATRLMEEAGQQQRGRWRMDNPYVYFLQAVPLEGDQLPLW